MLQFLHLPFFRLLILALMGYLVGSVVGTALFPGVDTLVAGMIGSAAAVFSLGRRVGGI